MELGSEHIAGAQEICSQSSEWITKIVVLMKINWLSRAHCNYFSYPSHIFIATLCSIKIWVSSQLLGNQTIAPPLSGWTLPSDYSGLHKYILYRIFIWHVRQEIIRKNQNHFKRSFVILVFLLCKCTWRMQEKSDMQTKLADSSSSFTVKIENLHTFKLFPYWILNLSRTGSTFDIYLIFKYCQYLGNKKCHKTSRIVVPQK